MGKVVNGSGRARRHDGVENLKLSKLMWMSNNLKEIVERTSTKEKDDTQSYT